MVEVLLASLPAGETEGTLQVWFFEEGDMVKEGQDLVELSTSEGSIMIPAPASGLLVELYYDEGEAVEKGEVLCCIDDEEGMDSEIEELE